MILCIAGGDERACCLAQIAAESGYIVQMLGFERAEKPSNLNQIQKGQEAEVVVLPAPYKNAAGHIPTPFGRSSSISIQEALASAAQNGLVFAGGVDNALEQAAHQKHIRWIDVLKDEAYWQSNAALTAEGALSALMNHTDHALRGKPIAILGYGRIGSRMAQMLRAVDAQPMIITSNLFEQEEARIKDLPVMDFPEFNRQSPSIWAIVNTIPARVFTKENLQWLKPGTLLCELASAPGCIHKETAEALGFRYWSEPGLPGRYCPATSAELMFSYIQKQIGELGE